MIILQFLEWFIGSNCYITAIFLLLFMFGFMFKIMGGTK